ncbi:MAG: peptidase M19 [Chitinophagaceae bacterium]|jgi:membrane dipeptidase|nr:MAG: peptidase M19 [Chitinophagaceae bacterium]
MDKNKIFIFDAHLDLAMNAIEWNRDLTRPLNEIRQREIHLKDKNDRGRGTVCLPELRKGKIGLVVATQLSRVATSGGSLPGSSWNSPQQAWAMTQAQLAWYREMEVMGEMVQITNNQEIDHHLALWNDSNIPDETKPIGYILSLEGADSLVDISYLDKAYNYGLRAVGLAHFSKGRYASGTKTEGGLTQEGFELLKEMDRLNMILDVTHLTDKGFKQVVEKYMGPVWASHCNVRKIVPTQRQLTDEQIKILIDRDAVIGGMLDCWALDIRFIDAVSDPWQLNIKLEHLVDHWDHICQIAGDSLHVAIGSDLDGNFGTEQTPYDMNSIADLQKYQSILLSRGYKQEDIENIFYKNWIRFLKAAWK